MVKRKRSLFTHFRWYLFSALLMHYLLKQVSSPLSYWLSLISSTAERELMMACSDCSVYILHQLVPYKCNDASSYMHIVACVILHHCNYWPCHFGVTGVSWTLFLNLWWCYLRGFFFHIYCYKATEKMHLQWLHNVFGSTHTSSKITQFEQKFKSKTFLPRDNWSTIFYSCARCLFWKLEKKSWANYR